MNSRLHNEGVFKIDVRSVAGERAVVGASRNKQLHASGSFAGSRVSRFCFNFHDFLLVRPNSVQLAFFNGDWHPLDCLKFVVPIGYLYIYLNILLNASQVDSSLDS